MKTPGGTKQKVSSQVQDRSERIRDFMVYERNTQRTKIRDNFCLL